MDLSMHNIFFTMGHVLDKPQNGLISNKRVESFIYLFVNFKVKLNRI